jgi:hypothetical protein
LTDAGLNERLELSQEDIDFYLENGWVKIRNVLPREVALHLRERFFAAAQEPKPPVEAPPASKRPDHVDGLKAQFVVHREARQPKEVRTAILSRRMGSVASQLLQVPRAQMFRTSIFEKLSQGAGGIGTGLHQDFPYLPLDRSRGLTIWVALGDLPVEMGALRFVSGSQRLGSLGRDEVFRPDQDYVRTLYDREKLELTPPLSLSAGDATIHSDLTIHGTDPNRSTETRLGMGSLYIDPDTLYTGAPFPVTDGMDLEVNKPFDPQRFPIVPA